jgi:UDP-glucose 4-epimerase
MNVLITGGAGFVGSHLAERLILGGRNVLIVDNLSTSSRENLDRILEHPRLAFVEGDVLDRRLIEGLVESSDVVVHLAGDNAVVVLDAAASHRRKILVASTSEVYGEEEFGPLCEEAEAVGPPCYAGARSDEEFLALAYGRQYNTPVVVARLFDVVGPRQTGREGAVLPGFVRSALNGEPLLISGDGHQSRNFTWVGDCVEALVRLLDCPAAEGEIVNIGGFREVSILELADRVKRLTRSSSPILFLPYDDADLEGSWEGARSRVPCLCKIQRLTDWFPLASVDDMVRAVVEYHEQARWGGIPAYSAYAPAQLHC